jgi:hypothetical protein
MSPFELVFEQFYFAIATNRSNLLIKQNQR